MASCLPLSESSWPFARQLEGANTQKRLLINILGWCEDRLLFWIPKIIPLKWLPEFTLWPNLGPYYSHDPLRKGCFHLCIAIFRSGILSFTFYGNGLGKRANTPEDRGGLPPPVRETPEETKFPLLRSMTQMLWLTQPCSIISQPRVTIPNSSHNTLFSLSEEKTELLPDLTSWPASWVYLILLYFQSFQK